MIFNIEIREIFRVHFCTVTANLKANRLFYNCIWVQIRLFQLRVKENWFFLHKFYFEINFLGCAAAQKSINLHFTECRVFLFDQCLIIAEDNNPSPSANTPSENTGVSNGFQANLGRVVYGSGSLFKRMGSYKFDLRPQRPLRLFTDDASHTPICGGRSPAVRRTVRIRRHGSHLSSLEFDSSGTLGGSGGNWPKLGWSTPHDPFRQSTYKFIHAVKVNRMAFTVSYFLSSAPLVGAVCDHLASHLFHWSTPHVRRKGTYGHIWLCNNNIPYL